MHVYEFLSIARIVPAEVRFIVLLLYREDLYTCLEFFRVCLDVDLMCLCLISMRAIMFGFGCCCNRACRSTIVVCMSLVLRVRAVMAGWM